MAAITPIISTLSFYKYEPTGSYVFTSDVGHTLQFSNSSIELLPFLTQTDPQTVTLSGTFSTSYTYPLSLVLGTLGALPNVSNTTTVTVGIGRFFPPIQGQVYQLYQYENISNTFGSNPVVTTVLPIDTLVSAPTLPPTLSVVSTDYTGQNFVFRGTPSLQQAQSNYKLIGTNTVRGGVVTVDIAIKVNAPRVVITPASADVTGMLIGTPITPVTFTAIQPNDNGPEDNFQYSWTPELPDGFSFVNVSNVPIQTFQYVDPTSPIQLVGTPTVATANLFAASGNPYVITLRGYHMSPAFVQTIGTSVISLSFAETVLLTSNIPRPLYEQKALISTDVVVTARTYFPLGSGIATLTADALPPGLSLSSLVAGSRFLVGTPTSASSGTYTFTATNSNGVFRSLAVPITVNANVVAFLSPTPANGSSVTFIVSRPLSVAKTGFYGSPIQFFATSTSGSSITYSSSINLTTYGLVLESDGKLTGIPISSLATTPVIITATDSLGTIGTTTLNITITSDIFTFPTATFALFQNRPMTPYQVIVTTLSERPIQSFSSVGAMPPGLTVSPSGLISGTPTANTGGTFTVSATTGYQAPPTATQLYTYTVQQDNFLLLQVNGVDTITPVFSNIQFLVLQYSKDVPVSAAFTLGSLYPPEYPLPTITLSSSGFLSGDFTNGPLFPTYLADITSVQGGVTSTTPVVFTFNNPSTSLLVAGYTETGIGTVSNSGHVSTTTGYVFGATPSGTHTVTDPVWVDNDFPVNYYLSAGFLYPDLAQYSNTFVAVNVSNVYDGVYNSSTRIVDWTETFPQDALIPYSLPVSIGRYTSIATDPFGIQVLLQSDDNDTFRMFTRIGTDEWDTHQSEPPYSYLNAAGDTTMIYYNGYYILGQLNRDADSNLNIPGIPNVLLGAVTPGKPRITPASATWTPATTPPAFSQVLRFAVSNSTIVAAGSGATSGGPLSYSVGGLNWTTPSLPAFMTGSNVVLNDIVFAANTWVTCGFDTDGSNMIAYSANLSNWVRYTIDPAVRWSAIAFNGNSWTIGGNRNISGSNQSTILSLDASPWPDQEISLGPLNGAIQFGSSGDPRFSRILSATFSNASTGTVFIPQGSLTFTEPAQSNVSLIQYVPYSFPVAAGGSSNFIFYYSLNVPIGFTFVPDPTGTFATLSGISPSNGSAVVNVYAKTENSAATISQITLNTIIPYFTRPQLGAGAYTAIVRKYVDANAAQNARDNRVFPVVNPLAGPFMAPRAPDVVTMSNCFLGLCKKPCPTCHTMM
jgi:hypothetical protein